MALVRLIGILPLQFGNSLNHVLKRNLETIVTRSLCSLAINHSKDSHSKDSKAGAKHQSM